MSGRTLPVAIAIFSTVCASTSCFSPDYGVGGFACTKGQCPEGYTCVTSGAGPVCRKAGAQADDGSITKDSVADRATGDAPGVDLPLTDLGGTDQVAADLLLDAPVTDQLAGDSSRDQALMDMPAGDIQLVDGAADRGVEQGSLDTTLFPDFGSPDQPQPDLTMPDLTTPDLAMPDSVVVLDLPSPDLAPDTMFPDLMIPDQMQPDSITPATCSAPALAAQGVALSKRSMDMALTQGGAPQIIYITEFDSLAHAYIDASGAWNQAKLHGGIIVERVSAAVSMETNDERLHTLYRKQDATNTPRIYHTYGSMTGPTVTWQAEVPVPTAMEVEDMDIGAHGEYIYIGASGMTMFSSGMKPIFNKWRLSRLPAGVYSYVSLGNNQGGPFWDTRTGVHQTHMGYAFYYESGTFRARMLTHTPHTGVGGTLKSIASMGTVASPTAVAVDASGNIHVAYVKIAAAGDRGTLHYAVWNGITDMSDPSYLYLEEEIVSDAVVGAESIDLVLSTSGQPHVSYFDGDGNLWWQVKTASGWTPQLVWSPGSSFEGWGPFHSTRIGLAGGNANIAFHGVPTSDTPNIYYTECHIN